MFTILVSRYDEYYSDDASLASSDDGRGDRSAEKYTREVTFPVVYHPDYNHNHMPDAGFHRKRSRCS